MAEGGVPLSEVKNECTICLESFTIPKLLPCFHTFCAVSLEKYIERTKKGNRFECPLCRKSTDVPSKGVKEFQTNFYLDETKDHVKRETIPCDGCSEKPPADHFCLDCEEHFCSRCTDSHMNMKLSRHHKLRELGSTEVGARPKIKARVFCAKHPNKEIEVICKQCDQLLCVLCMLMEHQSHRFKEISEETNDVRKTLRAKIDEEPLSQVVRRKDKKIQILQETNAKLDVARKEDIEYVRKRCAEVQKAVAATATQLETDLEKKYGNVIDENKSRIKEVEMRYASFVSLASTSEQALQLDNDIAVLKNSPTLCKQLDIERKKHRSDVSESDGSNMEVVHALVTEDTEIRLNVVSLFGRVEPIKIVPSKTKVQVSLPATSDPQKAMPLRPLQVTPISSKLKCVSKFQIPRHGKCTIYSIAPLSNDRAWVTFASHADDLCLVHLNGKLLQTVEIKQCYSATTDEKDNCFVTCQGDWSIKRVTLLGTVETIVSHKYGRLYGLAYRKTSNGEKQLLFSCTGTARGGAVFVVPCEKGSEVTTLCSQYACLFSMDVDEVEGKVCVADCGFNTCFILDEMGNKLHQYQSPGAYGVCFDMQGCFIITNGKSEAACRITKEGKFVEYLSAIKGRRAAVDSNNRIWVGSERGTLKFMK